MNRFQFAVVAGALANLALLLLFPPYTSLSVVRMGAPAFDAFYPVFDAPGNATIHSGLLYLEVFAVLINAAVMWLSLQDEADAPGHSKIRPQRALQWLIIADLALILLFPPFETRSLAATLGVRTFDGFSFALGGNVQNGIFLPLLFLELLLLGLNAAIFWLAFGMMGRDRAAAAPASQRTRATVDRPQARASAALAVDPNLGRAKRERRLRADPGYRGNERRKGDDRRLMRATPA